MGSIQRDLILYDGISTCKYKNLKNFRQINTDHIYCLEEGQQDIEQILKVWVDTSVIDSGLVITPVGTSLEGQCVTGYKLIVCGEIHLKFEYVGYEIKQGVYSKKIKYPFCGYVVLPENTNPSSVIKPSIVVEDILCEQIDLRCIYNNVTMMIIADIC